MSLAEPQAEPNDTAAEWAAERHRLLMRAAEVCITTAETVGRLAPAVMEAAATNGVVKGPDLGLTISRLTRMGAACVALDARLEDKIDRRAAKRAARRAADEARLAAEAAPRQIRAGKRDVLDMFRQAVRIRDDEAWDDLPREIESLFDTDRYDDDFTQTPSAEVAMRICEDVGLHPNWSAWQVDEDECGPAKPGYTGQVRISDMPQAIAVALGHPPPGPDPMHAAPALDDP